jgi:hypothetical protein
VRYTDDGTPILRPIPQRILLDIPWMLKWSRMEPELAEAALYKRIVRLARLERFERTGIIEPRPRRRRKRRTAKAVQ